MKHRCPVCGGDRLADQSEIRALMRRHGFTGEMVDPGGRVLYFGERSLRVYDQCNTCDTKAIREFLVNENLTTPCHQA